MKQTFIHFFVKQWKRHKWIAVLYNRFENEKQKRKETRKNSNNEIKLDFLVKQTTWLDGRHVVFGKVLKGMNVIRKIEASRTDGRDRPVNAVTIVNSGSLIVQEPFEVDLSDATD